MYNKWREIRLKVQMKLIDPRTKHCEMPVIILSKYVYNCTQTDWIVWMYTPIHMFERKKNCASVV